MRIAGPCPAKPFQTVPARLGLSPADPYQLWCTSLRITTETRPVRNRLAFTIVVPGCTLFVEVPPQLAQLKDCLHPFLFGFRRRFNGTNITLLARTHDVRDVICLLASDVNEVGRQRCLDDADK